MSAADPDALTEREREFLDLLARPSLYARWASHVRAEWRKTPVGREQTRRCKAERLERPEHAPEPKPVPDPGVRLCKSDAEG